MNVIIAAIVGFLAGRMLWLAIRQSWNRPPFLRTNYQGVSLPTAAGVVVSMAVVLTFAIYSLMAASDKVTPPVITGAHIATLIVVVGFTMLGLIDDLTGTTQVRGLVGHLKALGRGELTSGALKMFMGIAVAILGASFISPDDIGRVLLNAAMIALAANFFNLLDVRPGRAGKLSVAIFLLLALASAFDSALIAVAIAVGAGAALMLDDLHERLMLGDTGSNAIGAAIGVGLATQLEGSSAITAVVVFFALNALSEVTSYSAVIERVALLRALDAIGRRRSSTSSSTKTKSGGSRPASVDLRDQRGAARGSMRDSREGSLRARRQMSSPSGPSSLTDAGFVDAEPFDRGFDGDRSIDRPIEGPMGRGSGSRSAGIRASVEGAHDEVSTGSRPPMPSARDTFSYESSVDSFDEFELDEIEINEVSVGGSVDRDRFDDQLDQFDEFYDDEIDIRPIDVKGPPSESSFRDNYSRDSYSRDAYRNRGSWAHEDQ